MSVCTGNYVDSCMGGGHLCLGLALLIVGMSTTHTTAQTRIPNQTQGNQSQGTGIGATGGVLNQPRFGVPQGDLRNAATMTESVIPGFDRDQGFTGRTRPDDFIGGRQSRFQNTLVQQQQQFRQFGSSRNTAPRNTRGLATGRRATSQRRIVRPQVRVAFSYTVRPAARVTEALQSQFQRVSTRLPGFESVRVTTDEQGRVTLSGETGSQESRKLAENLVRLEPGVRSVQNLMTVRSGTTSDPPQP